VRHTDQMTSGAALTPDPLPPGPTGPPPAVFARFLLQPGGFLEQSRDRYGTPFTVRLSSQRTIVITDDPAVIKQVFTSDPTKLLAGVANVVLQPLLGPRSVLTLDDPEHMRQRKLLLPPFHGERMELYAEAVTDAAERTIAGWPVGRPFAVQPSMQAMTLEVIMRAVFGVTDRARLDEIAGPLRRLLDSMGDTKRLFLLQVGSSKRNGALSPWRRFREQLLHPADEVLYEEIAARRADPHGEDRDDILSLLLAARDEDGGALTDSELRDELMTLLLAGHETTATALSWTLERLVRHPDVLARLTEEVRSDEGGGEYLDAVIKESLRLRPVVPAVARYLTEPTELGGRVYPAGVHINPSIYLTHRRPDIYPEPECFRPERFLERPAGTYEWIPFGGGTRRCLGASFALYEMRIALAAILRSVDLATTNAPDERIGRRAITFTPGAGGEIEIARRLSRASTATAGVAA
jgi:cytochrome P450 family 135